MVTIQNIILLVPTYLKYDDNKCDQMEDRISHPLRLESKHKHSGVAYCCAYYLQGPSRKLI